MSLMLICLKRFINKHFHTFANEQYQTDGLKCYKNMFINKHFHRFSKEQDQTDGLKWTLDCANCIAKEKAKNNNTNK